jgi:energy-coupling factor transport system permease protein
VAFAVPFGNYLPGTSPLHRLDARFKLLLTAAYVAALFLVQGAPGLAVLVVLLAAAYLLARVPLHYAARGLKPVLIILAFTFLANTLTFQAQPPGPANTATLSLTFYSCTVPSSIAIAGGFGVRPLGAALGLYFVVRIVALVAATSLLTFTSPLVSTADAITSLLRPLRVLHVPVEDIAMMFTIALRFIPLTAEEAEKIVVAQSARGAVFGKGGPIRRVRAWLPVMVPLFVGLFRRADSLAAAMESRCYSGKQRTRIHVHKLHAGSVIGGLAASAALVLIGIFL